MRTGERLQSTRHSSGGCTRRVNGVSWHEAPVACALLSQLRIGSGRSVDGVPHGGPARLPSGLLQTLYCVSTQEIVETAVQRFRSEINLFELFAPTFSFSSFFLSLSTVFLLGTVAMKIAHVSTQR
jgi:hypothetical protein